MSFRDCCEWCCPCLASCKKASRFSYVRYTSSKVSPPAQPDTGGVPPDKVFEFPQEKSDFNTHPQMFMESISVVTDQPVQKGHRRFSAIEPTSRSKPVRSVSLPSAASYYSPTSCKTVTLPRTLQGDRESEPLRTMSPLHRSEKESTTESTIESTIESGSQCSPFALPMLEESSLQMGTETPLPVLQFSLLYDVQRSMLTVHLHHASNLPAKDRRGTSDPFVIVYMMPNKDEIFESMVIDRTLNPVFNQSFEFHRQHPDGIRQQTLVFRVYDHDRFSKNDLIGRVVFPLESADLFGVVMRMQIDDSLQLSMEDSRTQGDLLLALSYDQMLSTINGVVLKATNLKKQDIFGLADPYVKIYLYHDHKRISKWKSSIKRSTLIPVFNESFQFEISEGDVNSIFLKVVVMDYDRFSKNDVIGTIMLGSSVNQESGRKHWKEMILNPNSSVSQWHTII